MHPFILKGHERPVTIVRLNYDGDIFFSGSAERKINLWESYTESAHMTQKLQSDH